MKSILRSNMMKKIREINPAERKAIEQSLCTQLTKSKLWQKATVIGITHATELEWNTTSIMQVGWATGKQIAVPKINHRDKTMNFYAVQHIDELVAGYANILEPQPLEGEKNYNEEIDLLVVPGLVFDQHGYRLGFGGGYYDRYLAQPKHYTTTVSLVATFQLVANLPVDYYDIPIDNIITEHACIKITK